jgi:hypothetical protein
MMRQDRIFRAARIQHNPPGNAHADSDRRDGLPCLNATGLLNCMAGNP